jgi:drug/metabolite transporter (DMT)-like permease
MRQATGQDAGPETGPQSALRHPLLVVALIVALALCWGASWPMMKITLSEFPIWTFRAWSCLIAGLCLLGLARLAGERLMPPSSEWRGLMLAALCNVTAWHLLIGYGVVIVASGHAAVLAYTMPLWVVVLGTIFFRQPLEMQSIVGLGLGLAGILTLVSTDLATLGKAPLGAALILLGAIAWAAGTLIQKHRRTVLATFAVTGWQLVLGSLPIFLMMPMIDGVHMPQVSGRAWATGTYLTFVALVICYFLWFKIVSLMPVNRASISSLLVPAVGITSGALVLGEPFGWREVLALGLIASAVMLVLTVRAGKPVASAG